MTVTAVANRRTHWPTLAYVGLSVCAGTLELGVVVVGWSVNLPVRALLTLALVYQLGALLLSLLRPVWGVHAACALMTTAALLLPSGYGRSLAALSLLSFGIHGLRQCAHAASREISTERKRAARIMGFLLAPLMASGPGLMLVAISAVVIALPVRKSAAPRPPTTSSLWQVDWLKLTMVVHQAHYFCYVYMLMAVIFSEWATVPVVAAAVFALGWVTYVSASTLWRRVHPETAFSFGHATVVLLLIGLTLTSSPFVTAMLWILTGFGGGTVFVLRRRAHQRLMSNVDFDVWENIGHVAGVAVALAVASLGPKSTLFAAAGFAAASPVLLWVARRRPAASLS